MTSRILIGPEGGPFVEIDEDNGTLDFDAPSGEVDFQGNRIVNATFGNVSTLNTSSSVTASPDDIVLADASGGTISITLPAAVDGDSVVVKKVDASNNAVSIATPGTETIDGQSSIDITNQFAARTVASDGSNYFII